MEYSNIPIVIPSVSVGIKAKAHFATLDCHVATSLLLAMTSGKFNIPQLHTKACNFICALRKFYCGKATISRTLGVHFTASQMQRRCDASAMQSCFFHNRFLVRYHHFFVVGVDVVESQYVQKSVTSQKA